jgi:hypothetical protein
VIAETIEQIVVGAAAHIIVRGGVFFVHFVFEFIMSYQLK